MKVENMFRNGRSVPNQFVINTENGKYMQSYDRVCVLKPHGCGSNVEIIVSKWWDYSNTTLKYVKQFINSVGVSVGSKADITRKIKNGEIRLVDDIILS